MLMISETCNTHRLVQNKKEISLLCSHWFKPLTCMPWLIIN
uniref:Uncharacterized protein n=1 Tax=Arundo donax TaxID=35708 RepID=A0A0A8ZUR6_ARUDO